MDFNTFLRYKGFLKTPQLWKDAAVFQLEQLNIKDYKITLSDTSIFQNKRLGKLVEEFLIHQLKQNDAIKWIADNVQIQNGKQTIGELDALFYNDSKAIHLEVVYKFYLYDTIKTYTNPLAYWIGPNRKDTFIHKLEKLKQKQLPLLLNPNCRPYLEKLNLNPKKVRQNIAFKAQLFLPFNTQQLQIEPLNEACISGFHLPFRQMEILKYFQFYIPAKLDWLTIPHKNVDWLDYETVKNSIEVDIYSRRSPLIWLKDTNNQLSKCFITFW